MSKGVSYVVPTGRLKPCIVFSFAESLSQAIAVTIDMFSIVYTRKPQPSFLKVFLQKAGSDHKRFVQYFWQGIIH